jgi:hypothetical protein
MLQKKLTKERHIEYQGREITVLSMNGKKTSLRRQPLYNVLRA